MGKVLTVVVPSHNVEKYLDHTLASLAEETMIDDLEVLVSDDGSKDHTAEIGKKYEEKYPQTFRVISKESSRYGAAINTGIMEGQGKYFKVLDGADWVNTSDFVKLVGRLKECDADYVVTNYCEVDHHTKEEKLETFPELEQDKVIDFDEIAGETQIGFCSLVIKTSLLKDHNIRTQEHTVYADIEYLLYPIPYIETVVYYDLSVHMHRVRRESKSSAMRKAQRNMKNHAEVIFCLIDFLKNYRKGHGKRDRIQYIGKQIAQMIGDQISVFMSFPLEDKEIKRQFIEFDRKLKQNSQLMYQMAGEESGMLRALRKHKFRFYKTIIRLSRVRNGKLVSKIPL